jgi:p-cumate 2,3-dioxygenase subunit beta
MKFLCKKKKIKGETVKSNTLDAIQTRLKVEDFLYLEARLLDQWKLEEWLSLLSPNVEYVVPATDTRGDYSKTLCIIWDDSHRLHERVRQLMGQEMWCENPKSQTVRQISNVTVEHQGDTKVSVRANFVIHRFGRGSHHTFAGHYEIDLEPHGSSFLLLRRVAWLAHESLLEQGRVSIIL